MTGLPILKSLRASIGVTNDEVNCIMVTPIKSTPVLFAEENPYFQFHFYISCGKTQQNFKGAL